MVQARYDYSAITMNNREFVIGGQINNNSCEIFDCFTSKFTFVKIQFNFVENISLNQIVSVGNKVYFFVNEEHNDVKVYSYDVENNTFGEKRLFENWE